MQGEFRQGEFRGDFTRDTFDPTQHFLRVLMQQGRVQLDADWNEQISILLHYLQALAEDLIGPHGGRGDGFSIAPPPDGVTHDFRILPGRYYVRGLLCENEDYTTYLQQPVPPRKENGPPLHTLGTYLVYLDVWERHITYVEDADIREVALGGPDTMTRAKLVWQVKATNKKPDGLDIKKDDVWPTAYPIAKWSKWEALWQPINRGLLKARAKQGDNAKEADNCLVSPEARYRGLENQLYRVEIHQGGRAWQNAYDDLALVATFKWSRENGSVVFPIRTLATDADGTVQATLVHLGRDGHLGLKEKDWVEVLDDSLALQGRAGPLLQVASVDSIEMRVTLTPPPSDGGIGTDIPLPPPYAENSLNHPLLRRWDQRAGDPRQGGLALYRGAALLKESGDDKGWLTLEEGVQVLFAPTPAEGEQQYRSGDYWLIPARTATGDVEWPGPSEAPEALPPHGVYHRYAPLAIIAVEAGGNVTLTPDALQGDLRHHP